MSKPRLAVTVILGMSLLLWGCSSEADPQPPSGPPLDQMPLMLAGPLFTAGYELAGYYDLDADGDGIAEALAILTLIPPTTESSWGSSQVLLFGQHGGAWSLNDKQTLDGVYASAELCDLTGDGVPEVLVHTTEVDTQPGDLVTALRQTDHLSVFTYAPGQYLVQLGAFTSSLWGETQPRSTVVEWKGQPAIQTAQDIPPVGQSMWRPFRVETFTWDGQGFTRVEVGEQRRIAPIVSWLLRRNAPWLAVFLIMGVVAGAVASAITRRSRLKERWGTLVAILLFVASGVGLGLAVEWLCVPAFVLAGLAAFGLTRQMVKRWGDKMNDGA